MDGGYKGWNPYIEKHLAIFVNCFMLFQKEKLTLAQASRFAGMNRIAFQHLLASRQIPVHYDVEDFEQDIKNLREMGRL